MILTKDKTINSSKIKKLYNKRPLKKMKKALFAVAIVSGLFVAGNTVILSSDVVKTSNLVKEKIEYYNNLNSYNNFYKAMEAVPYTEDDFKKDLSLFEYLYVNNNAVSDKVFNTKEVGFYNFTEMKLKYLDRQEFFPQFLKETSSMNYSDNNPNDNNGYNPYKKAGIYKELLNDKNGGVVKFNRILSSYFMMGGNNHVINYPLIKDELNNIREYTLSKGFSADLYSVPTNLISKNLEEEKIYDQNRDFEKSKESRERFYEEKKRIGEANMKTLLSYYKNKDYDKLREVFKIGNAYSKVMIENAPTLERKRLYFNNMNKGLSGHISGYINLSPLVLKYSEMQGLVNQENRQYYENMNLFYWF